MRRRDAEATKAALLKAAAELFTERGFDRTSVREVAAVVGVDQALVFRYFGTKEDLLAAVLTAPGRALSTDADDLLDTVIRAVFANSDTTANLLLLALTGPQRGKVADALETQVAQPYRLALAGQDADEDALLRADLVLAWLLGIALVQQICPDGPVGSADRERARELVGRAARNLLGDAARTAVDAQRGPQ
ncbi:TetR/AcrR family transcriptional regulator [Actinokineospora fastidiosa]|uniref:TetR family transcriptional regulator n=1 Tax=Actinokineospora fastidiosa TaxID=1816 RepID=A0A918GEY3_9PSEU|nr:TetR/AcrR family transcriptional regulator [Actinokineospora fastidiosa]GGS32030.1 TetR family transcriptional regulator [Actinokineospora fastidiosa]